jgi:hypothetical protein
MSRIGSNPVLTPRAITDANVASRNLVPRTNGASTPSAKPVVQKKSAPSPKPKSVPNAKPKNTPAAKSKQSYFDLDTANKTLPVLSDQDKVVKAERGGKAPTSGEATLFDVKDRDGAKTTVNIKVINGKPEAASPTPGRVSVILNSEPKTGVKTTASSTTRASDQTTFEAGVVLPIDKESSVGGKISSTTGNPAIKGVLTVKAKTGEVEVTADNKNATVKISNPTGVSATFSKGADGTEAKLGFDFKW